MRFPYSTESIFNSHELQYYLIPYEDVLKTTLYFKSFFFPKHSVQRINVLFESSAIQMFKSKIFIHLYSVVFYYLLIILFIFFLYSCLLKIVLQVLAFFFIIIIFNLDVKITIFFFYFFYFFFLDFFKFCVCAKRF